MSHQDVNRALWDGMADQWVESAKVDWASPEPAWGMWRVPEAEVHALPDLEGLDAIELGCGTASSRPRGRCRRSTASSSR